MTPLSEAQAEALTTAINNAGGSVTTSDIFAWAGRMGTTGSPSDLDLLKLTANRIIALGD